MERKSFIKKWLIAHSSFAVRKAAQPLLGILYRCEFHLRSASRKRLILYLASFFVFSMGAFMAIAIESFENVFTPFHRMNSSVLLPELAGAGGLRTYYGDKSSAIVDESRKLDSLFYIGQISARLHDSMIREYRKISNINELHN
jgi:hypothetical protein